MMADAAEYQEYQPVFYIAVTVADWTGLDVESITDRNYLTLECAEELREALVNFEIKHKTKHNLRPGIAWLELYAACLNRHHLVEEEEKLRIAVAIADQPGAFDRETWSQGWEIPGVGHFPENPKRRVTDEHWASFGSTTNATVEPLDMSIPMAAPSRPASAPA